MKPLKHFDQWLDREDDYCPIHGRIEPCWMCQQEALLEQAEMRRDEQTDLRTET